MSKHLEEFRAMLDSIGYRYLLRERGPHTDIDTVMGEIVVRLIFREGRLLVFMVDDASGYPDLEPYATNAQCEQPNGREEANKNDSSRE